MINIFGAGLSGLTIALELVQKGFDVSVYEKNNIAGGMARSVRTKDNVPTEHSWRGYGPFYYNLFDVMKRIPFGNKEEFSNNKEYEAEEIKLHHTKKDLWVIFNNQVYDLSKFVENHPGGNIILKANNGKELKDLKEVWEENGVSWHLNNNTTLNVLKKHKIGILKEDFDIQNNTYNNLNHNKLDFRFLFNEKNNKYNKGIKLIDYPNLVYILGKSYVTDLRKVNDFKILIEPILKKNMSKQTYHYLLDYICGPGYGFDKNTISMGHFAYFVELNQNVKNDIWSTLNRPTNEGFIDPFVSYLKKLGVKFYFNHSLKKINFFQNKIENCIVYDGIKDIEINGQEYIMCLDPFTYSNILDNSNINEPKYLNLNTVNNQISFRLGFDKEIKFKDKYLGFVLIDSPYNITFYQADEHWVKTDLGMDGKIKSLWSGTLILPYNNGSKYNKSATQLNIDKLLEEIIYQIFESHDLKEIIQNQITKNNIIFREVFEDWYYNDNLKMLQTKNKKWVNNAFNEEYRPNQNTKFKNLWVGGGHTKTSINIWSMEGAVESGKILSNLILNKYGKDNCYYFKHSSNNTIKFLKKIDNILYKFKLPNVLDLILFLIIFIILFSFLR